MHFKGEMVHFFLKNESLRSESVNGIIDVNNQNINKIFYKFIHSHIKVINDNGFLLVLLKLEF